MMRKAVLLFILFGVCALFNSCGLDDDDQNFHFTTLAIIDATVPDSFDLNETYTIEVTYLRPNGCTFFEGFDFAKPAETDRDIVAIGSVLTEDTACTQAVEEVVATFEFNVIFTEDYHFRFFSGTDENDNSTYLEYTIPVNVPN
ncbi:MAG: hypothetical protein ABJN84_07545 [Flavobacteriaceae bacterium]